MYIKVTIEVPKNKLNPILRCGFFISPAIKVTLFQESLLKIDPTIAAAINPIKAVPPTGTQVCVTDPSANVEAIACLASNAFVQFSLQKLCLENKNPTIINPNKEMSLVNVKVF